MTPPAAPTPGAAAFTTLPPVDCDLLIDCDTGMDDALALLLAFGVPGARVLGVGCVDGNVGVDAALRNTLAVLDVAGAPPVPVARGCPAPLATMTRDAAWVHGPDGLGGARVPAPRRRPAPVTAPELYRRVLTTAARPVTVVALGPLTNLAVLLTMHPEVRPGIGRLVVMGGSAAAGGNDEPAAEFNVAHDPEAADIVLRSGVDITLYGLDVFTAVSAGPPWLAELAAAGTPAAALAHDLLDRMRRRWGSAGLGDAGALAVALWPDLARTQRHPAVVELAGRHSRGATIVDRRPRAEWAPHNDTTWPELDVCWQVDAATLLARYLAAVRRGPGQFSSAAPASLPLPAAMAGELEFLVQAHRLTGVPRFNRLLGGDRPENSAEHSWHAALAAQLLLPRFAPELDQARVLAMLLLHDLPEVVTGDVPIHDAAARQAAAAAEADAAAGLFGPAQLALWQEFAAAATPEARFANAIDRLQPILLHWAGDGAAWAERGITAEQERRIAALVEALWPALAPVAAALVEDAHRRGLLR